MSVVGIDLGNDGMVISAPVGQGKTFGKGGIDIILNEASNRRTQTVVSFYNNQRFIGESAANIMNSNVKNTVRSLKRFIGCKYSESIVQEEKLNSTVKVIQLDNDRIGFEVNYCEKTEVFLPEQLLAMLLYRVKEITDLFTEFKSPTFDVVLSVPPYYSESQRRAILNSCSIANIKCLRLLNENVCSAVSYGIYKNHQGLFDTEKPQYVMFVDMGQASCYASVVGFIKDKLKVVSCTYDRYLGGRMIDKLIVDSIANDFMKKHGIDPRENKKSLIKMYKAAEQVKKIISPVGVNKAQINIEYMYEDNDYTGVLELETLISLIKSNNINTKLSNVVRRANEVFKSIEPNGNIISYEIIGGSLRIPFLKEIISETLGLDKSLPNMGLSTTLNMDECVAIGAGWLSAMSSVRFRIKDYCIADNTHYAIKLSLKGCDLKEYRVHSFPTEVMMYRENNSVISIDIDYDERHIEEFPSGHEMKIGRYQIGFISTVPPNTPVLLKIDHDANGLISLRATSKYEITVQKTIEVSEEEYIDTQNNNTKTDIYSQTENDVIDMNVKINESKNDTKLNNEINETKANTTEPVEPKPKKIKRTKVIDEKKNEIVIYDITSTEYNKINRSSLSIDEIKQFQILENKMRQKDQEIISRSIVKNELEAFIYNTRNNIHDLNHYIKSDEKETYLAKLTEHGNWLNSEEGYESKKVDYETRLHDLQSLYNIFLLRKEQSLKIKDSINSFIKFIEGYYQESDTTKLEMMKPILDENNRWIKDIENNQKQLKPWDKPIIDVSDIINRRNDAFKKLDVIQHPPPPPPPPPPQSDQEKNKSTEPNNSKDDNNNNNNKESNPNGKMEEAEEKNVH